MGGQTDHHRKVTISFLTGGRGSRLRWIPWWLEHDQVPTNHNSTHLAFPARAWIASKCSLLLPSLVRMPAIGEPWRDLVSPSKHASQCGHMRNRRGELYWFGWKLFGLALQVAPTSMLTSNVLFAQQNNSFGASTTWSTLPTSYSFFSLQNLGTFSLFFPLLPNFTINLVIYDTVYQLILSICIVVRSMVEFLWCQPGRG